MKVKNRFLTYIAFDTQSSDESTTSPSTLKQKDLGAYLVKELQSIGIANAYMDDWGYVYAKIKSNTNCDINVGLIAHMDTATECSGANVKPQIIPAYQGKTITLSNGASLNEALFPILKKYRGHELITTDGTTLLGGDDKAGIAIIVEAVAQMIKDDLLRPNIVIVFTPDEEIGRGTDHFNFDHKIDFAYTIDGGPINQINFENFNAHHALIEINGKSIHPGDAKNRMVNSQLVAMEFNSMLPIFQNPASTEKYEGFFHLTTMDGSVAYTKLNYLLRDHDEVKMQEKINLIQSITNYLNEKYGDQTIVATIKESYRNMRPIILQNNEVLQYPIKALKRKGIEAEFVPTRGGTDGARLSFKGIPCPNLGTGTGNHHGPFEFASVDAMEKMVEVIIEMMGIIAN